jgi:hypothetical protein
MEARLYGQLYAMLLDISIVSDTPDGVTYELLNGVGGMTFKAEFRRWYPYYPPGVGSKAVNSRGEIYDPQPEIPNEG